MTAVGWTVAYRLLWAASVLSAALNMLHVRGGFLTSHLADLMVPALLYVFSRGLVPGRRAPARANPLARLMRWLGRSPERAAAFFFLASTATEVSQRYWPQGLFAGRFDPWDIAAFGAGIAVCYGFDKWQLARRE